MPSTPSPSELRAHLTALLPSTRDRDRASASVEVVVAHDDEGTLATTLEILSGPTVAADAQPQIHAGTSAAAPALPRR